MRSGLFTAFWVRASLGPTRPWLCLTSRRVSKPFSEIKAENELALAYAGFGRLQKKQGEIARARHYLTKALEIFERLGTPSEPDKVREELTSLPVF